jgi:hypothetical protein
MTFEVGGVLRWASPDAHSNTITTPATMRVKSSARKMGAAGSVAAAAVRHVDAPSGAGSEPEDEDEEIFEVERVLDCAPVGNSMRYLVRWLGYAAADDTWEPGARVN